ncbi:hypothetical protein MAM1_0054d03508 [Mucor ambiguus]|uniref:Galactose oxidase n=1 Tax=Mucor ambiguus TaxID=91626 RepID=A0A0C9M9Q2_9FUNG|nr:hypothetical protein MAM1_0054d03508 [Mucor ambiguus]
MCFGGSPNDKGYDTTVNYLDISQSDSTNVSNLENKWDIQVVPKVETDIINEPRYDSQYTALPDGARMLMQGGSNELLGKLQNKTVIYDTRNEQWSSLSDYTEPRNGGARQIFSGTAVYVPFIDAVAFYGGKEARVPSNFTYRKLDGTTFSNSYTYNASLPNQNQPYFESYVGFYYLTIYRIISNTWEEYSATPYNIMPNQLTATYHEPTDTIYYLGGRTYDPIVTHDNWDNITLTGTQIPTPRVLHSATLLTGTANTILIYGGSPSESDDPVQDYCYTLDIGTLVWTAHSLSAISPNIGPRFYHNAVLVNNTALFILFGKTTGKHDTTNNVSVLDVRNVSAIQFSDHFPLEGEESTAMTTENNAKESDSVGPSSGAIAGIIVGAIAAVVALVIAILLYRRKRRAAKEQHEALDVDWDQIEHQFHEVPPTKRESMASPTSTLVATTATQVPNAVQSDDANNKNIMSLFHENPISQTGVVKPDGGKEDKSQLP